MAKKKMRKEKNNSLQEIDVRNLFVFLGEGGQSSLLKILNNKKEKKWGGGTG